MVLKNGFLLLVFFVCFATANAWAIFNQEDGELIADTVKFNANSEIKQTTTTSLSTTKPQIQFYGEASIAYSHFQYDDPFSFWEYSHRFVGGLSLGIVKNVIPALRLRTGLRFFQTGNRVNMKLNYLSYEYDTLTWNVIDSTPEYFEGFFENTAYYLSLPLYLDIVWNGLPISTFIGGEIGYLLAATIFDEVTSNDIKTKEEDYNMRSHYNNWNCLVNLGVGYNFAILNKFNSEIQIAYSFSVLNISAPDGWASNFKSRELSLRYIFIFRNYWQR